MADAVLAQRVLIGAAALCGLFLVTFFFLACFALLAKAVDRYRQADAQVADILAELPAPTAAPVIDTRPGINLAARDECELIWASSQYIDPAGIDRLKAAIRDHQKGEQA